MGVPNKIILPLPHAKSVYQYLGTLWSSPWEWGTILIHKGGDNKITWNAQDSPLSSPQQIQPVVLRLRNSTLKNQLWAQACGLGGKVLAQLQEVLDSVPSITQPGMVTHCCKSNTVEGQSEDQKFKVILRHTVSLWSAWATSHPVSKQATKPQKHLPQFLNYKFVPKWATYCIALIFLKPNKKDR